MKHLSHKFTVLPLISALSLLSITPVFAAMSQQFNQDAAGLGDAQAGSAASALDASTEFYNPAGLVRIKQQQAVMGINLNMPTNKFSGSSTLNGTTTTGDENGAESYETPYLHYAAPISDKWAFGFGISSPFQMNSNWGSNSSVSPNTTNTELTTYQISTDLAYAVNQKLSIGYGYDFVRTVVTDYNYESSNGSDYQTNLGGTQWSRAFHGGILYQFTPETRAGLAYHSKIDYSASGGANTTDSNGDILQSTNDFSLKGILPAYTTASVYHQLNAQWVLEGSINYTQWHQLDKMTYDHVPTDSSITTNTQTYNFQDTWRFALGAHYALNDQVLLRFGAGYETSPYKDDDVYMQAPVGASYDASAGVHVVASNAMAVDLGWTHIFYQDQSVDTSNSVNNSTTSGDFEGSSDILGAQLVWNMT